MLDAQLYIASNNFQKIPKFPCSGNIFWILPVKILIVIRSPSVQIIFPIVFINFNCG